MKIKAKLAVMFFVAAAALSGCSSKKRIEPMDFQAKIELKTPEPAVSAYPRILFVGNSHTFYNNLSAMFVNIINCQGYEGDVRELAYSYYTLKQYADTDDQGGALLDKTLEKLNWDFVILQENTSNALSSVAEEEMFPPSRILDEKIRASGGQSVFLMTWAPRDGMKVGMRKQNRETIQSDLASTYMGIARELDALMVPAGVGFMRSVRDNPDIDLWDEDGQHPSSAGSYLTACILYSVIYQESPEDCPYVADLDTEVAKKLQKTAAELVLK